MNARVRTTDVNNSRLLSAAEASAYCSLGRNGMRAWAEQIGAIRKIGSRVLFDKTVIDKALDEMTAD